MRCVIGKTGSIEGLTGTSGMVILITQGDPNRMEAIAYWEVSYSIVVADCGNINRSGDEGSNLRCYLRTIL